MLRQLRSTLVLFGMAVFAACGSGGGDSATGGNPPAPKRASLTVTISNAPAGATTAVTVEGPSGFSRTLSATTTITDLTPGSYTVAAANAETESAIYAPMPAAQNIELAPGSSRSIDIAYALSTGSLDVAISGLPAGAEASVNITGPNGYSRIVTTNQVLNKLAPGPYVVTAASVTASGDGYAPIVAGRTVPVSATSAPYLLGVEYTIVTGRLQVAVNGLPSGASPTLQVTGPNGYSRGAAPSETLLGLEPGNYTITSPNVTMNGNTYAPTATTVTVAVAASANPAQTTVAYALAGGGGMNLTIDNLYVTQAVQTMAGDVPLVAGRDGLVRVFVKASSVNSAQPHVRVRLYNGATLLTTLTLNAPTSAVPTTVDDASLTSAWYSLVPAQYIQPGLRILADVDPANAITEGSEADNTWPGTGSPAAMTVKTVPTFSIRFVPIKQSNDLTGNVTTANTAAFLNDIRRMFPVGAVDVDVRATYTSTSGIVQANDNNNAWNQVLSEMNGLRAVDGSSRYYYGVLKTSYSSGVAGMGYLGYPLAIGWDHLPSGADVMAHELGHNWGRYHAPCGGAGSPDPSYPYAGGKIGVSGFDLTTNTFKLATTPDLMGYCVPDWVSDFTYKGIMSYRETHPLIVDAMRSRAPEPGLLVWGRITGSQIVLEPAFNVVAPPLLPEGSGAHRVEGLADDGTVLFSYNFEGMSVDHSQSDRHFAYVIPQSVLRGRVLGALRLRSNGRLAELRSAAASSAELPRVRRLGAAAAQVTWSDPAVRGVLVRDARTGDVLSFARGRSARIETGSRDVELVISDGVRSHVRRVAVR